MGRHCWRIRNEERRLVQSLRWAAGPGGVSRLGVRCRFEVASWMRFPPGTALVAKAAFPKGSRRLRAAPVRAGLFDACSTAKSAAVFAGRAPHRSRATRGRQRADPLPHRMAQREHDHTAAKGAVFRGGPALAPAGLAMGCARIRAVGPPQNSGQNFCLWNRASPRRAGPGERTRSGARPARSTCEGLPGGLRPPHCPALAVAACGTAVVWAEWNGGHCQDVSGRSHVQCRCTQRSPRSAGGVVAW